MSKVTVTFDPDNMFTTATFARARGISSTGALAWINRHAENLPAPAFTLRSERAGSPPMFTKYWHAADGKKILAYAERLDTERTHQHNDKVKAGRRRLARVLPARSDAQL